MDDMSEVETLIRNSGNNFHSKVVTYLKQKGWTILVSPYYNDNVSDKPREIDLVAEIASAVTRWGQTYLGDIHVRLFIECKYVPQLTAFWFHDKDMPKARELVISSTPMRDDNTGTDDHHYLRNGARVAKLFASTSEKNADREVIYKALNQSLNAMVYFRNGKSIVPKPRSGTRQCLTTLNYPLIVCNSFERFYGVGIDSADPPKRIDQNFQLEVNYAYMDSSQKHKSEYFLIDVVDFEKMDEFLELIKQDLRAMQVFVGGV